MFYKQKKKAAIKLYDVIKKITHSVFVSLIFLFSEINVLDTGFTILHKQW